MEVLLCRNCLQLHPQQQIQMHFQHTKLTCTVNKNSKAVIIVFFLSLSDVDQYMYCPMYQYSNAEQNHYIDNTSF